MSDSLDEAIDILNEALALDPNLLQAFTTMTPCSPVVGKITPLELMAISEKEALVSTLGIVNGLFSKSNARITIASKVKEGRVSHYFTRVNLDGTANLNQNVKAISPNGHEEGVPPK